MSNSSIRRRAACLVNHCAAVGPNRPRRVLPMITATRSAVFSDMTTLLLLTGSTVPVSAYDLFTVFGSISKLLPCNSACWAR